MRNPKQSQMTKSFQPSNCLKGSWPGPPSTHPAGGCRGAAVGLCSSCSAASAACRFSAAAACLAFAFAFAFVLGLAGCLPVFRTAAPVSCFFAAASCRAARLTCPELLRILTDSNRLCIYTTKLYHDTCLVLGFRKQLITLRWIALPIIIQFHRELMFQGSWNFCRSDALYWRATLLQMLGQPNLN